MAATVSHTAYVTNANIFCGCFAAFASDIHSIRPPRRFISGNDCHFALTNAAFFAMMKADQNKGESV